MPEDRSPEEVRNRIASRYTAAASAASVPDPTAQAGPRDLAALDLKGEGGRALFVEDAPPGALAQAAGYADEDVATVPEGAFRGSFACATPVSLADIQPGQTVLDLGCGQGLDVILAARLVGPTGRCIGVDLTQAQLDRAQAHIAETGLANTDLRQGPMEALPVESASVDWIISNGAINYSPEKPKVFAEAFRVLKPGGQLLGADVLVEDLDPALGNRLFGYVQNAGGATGEAAYLALIHAAGFKDVDVVARTEFTAGQILQFLGYDAEPTDEAAAADPELVSLLAGKLAATAIHARKPA